MIDNSRVDKIFWLFGHVMPMPQDESKRKALEAILGGKMEQVTQQFMKLLSLMMKQNPETAEMWIEFISQATSYMQCKSDKIPETNLSDEELERLWQVYGVNHKQ